MGTFLSVVNFECDCFGLVAGDVVNHESDGLPMQGNPLLPQPAAFPIPRKNARALILVNESLRVCLADREP